MFLSLDGIDGGGKSTQMKLLVDWLRTEHGRQVVTCRDPGSTKLGEVVRGILLGHHDTPVGKCSEMLLFMAARAQLVEEVIRPALDSGADVVCDRFLLANVVYQGYAGNLRVDDLWTVGRIATGGLSPTRTLVFDLDPELAMQRLPGTPDRMERRGLGFLTQVREGFLTEARRRPQEIFVIDAAQPIDAVQQQLRACVAEVLTS
jgi:dTMP kinase